MLSAVKHCFISSDALECRAHRCQWLACATPGLETRQPAAQERTAPPHLVRPLRLEAPATRQAPRVPPAAGGLWSAATNLQTTATPRGLNVVHTMDNAEVPAVFAACSTTYMHWRYSVRTAHSFAISASRLRSLRCRATGSSWAGQPGHSPQSVLRTR